MTAFEASIRGARAAARHQDAHRVEEAGEMVLGLGGVAANRECVRDVRAVARRSRWSCPVRKTRTR